MNPELEHVGTVEMKALAALDHLNRWVRSDSYRKQYLIKTGPRQAVYDMKGVAIAWAISAGLTTHRRVMASVPCRDCSGTGRYTDFWGCEHPHCRNCNSTGKKALRFLETTIAEQFVWHTPWDKVPLAICNRLAFPIGGMEALGEGWFASFDWEPGRDGQDMSIVEAAEALLLAEQVFPYSIERRGRSCDTFADRKEAYYGSYHLFIGETERRCCYCGTTDQIAGIHCNVERLAFRTFACTPCSNQRGKRLWSDAVCPPEFLTPSAIQEWRERHPLSQKVRVG